MAELEEEDLIYCYRGTQVLKNTYGEQNPESLSKLERILCGARLVDLLHKPLKGKFDAAHLRKIHQYIFQDLYTWAGKYRVIEIAKGYYFCRSQYVPRETDKLMLELQAENYLRSTQERDLPYRAAYYLGEINAIHPFRDGNGRTQREFIRELLLPLGFTVLYSKVAPRMMFEASVESFQGNNAKMVELFKTCIVPLSELK
ncbi:MAG: Fic family protein [Succinivibrio sp.]|nr:Fic family protein [Succinivibrio sp.]